MSGLLEYKLDLIAEAMGVYKIEDVTSVIRRRFTRKDGEVADVVDLYPPWNATGTYGFMKVATEYMDHDWQKKRFEKFAGVSFDSLPVYEAKQADQRVYGRPSKHEVQVQPFRLMLKPRPVENGPDEKTLILRYLPAGQVASQQPVAPTAPATTNSRKPAAAPAQTTNGNGRHGQPLANESVGFDDLISASEQKFARSLLAKQPWFKSEESIMGFRKVLFGEWDATRETAFWVGLLRYAELRKAHQSHQMAKIEALNRYHRELKEKNHETSPAG